MAKLCLAVSKPDLPLKPGQVLHTDDCSTQAIVLAEYLAGSEPDQYVALQFNVCNGKRVFNPTSTLLCTHTSAWHVAEYQAGMEVTLPPPHLPSWGCDYDNNRLSTGDTCTCGCGRTLYICACSICAESYGCDNNATEGDGNCDDCQDTYECECPCGCESQSHSGGVCGSCEDTYLCGKCESIHVDNRYEKCEVCIEDDRSVCTCGMECDNTNADEWCVDCDRCSSCCTHDKPATP